MTRSDQRLILPQLETFSNTGSEDHTVPEKISGSSNNLIL